jgi:hypothetical protein
MVAPAVSCASTSFCVAAGWVSTYGSAAVYRDDIQGQCRSRASNTGRPGSWEGNLVQSLVKDTVGSNDEHLTDFPEPS